MGLRTVPYDSAMERIFDKDDDKAAPIVPDDNAKAATQLVRVIFDEGDETNKSCYDQGWVRKSRLK